MNVKSLETSVHDRAARLERRAFAPANAPARVTPRQREIVALIAAGLTDAEIAEELGISARTVRAHCEALRVRLGVRRRREIPLGFRLATGEDPFARIVDAGAPVVGRVLQRSDAPATA
jgi:DNA-binding CsgD family transcriptional regulator